MLVRSMRTSAQLFSLLNKEKVGENHDVKIRTACVTWVLEIGTIHVACITENSQYMSHHFLFTINLCVIKKKLPISFFTPEVGHRTHWLKCDNNKSDDVSSLNNFTWKPLWYIVIYFIIYGDTLPDLTCF